MDKRGNFSSFSQYFQHILLTKGVKVHVRLWNLVVWLVFCSFLHIWYVEVRISRSFSEGPLDFEIKRVNCSLQNILNQKTFLQQLCIMRYVLRTFCANVTLFLHKMTLLKKFKHTPAKKDLNLNLSRIMSAATRLFTLNTCQGGRQFKV